MRSALDPNRRETLEHRLDVRLAARRAERAARIEAAKKGWDTRRYGHAAPLIQHSRDGGNSPSNGAARSRRLDGSEPWTSKIDHRETGGNAYVEARTA